MQSRMMRPGSKSFALKPGGSAADIMVRHRSGAGARGWCRSWLACGGSAFDCCAAAPGAAPSACESQRRGLPGIPRASLGPYLPRLPQAHPTPTLQVMSGSAGGLVGFTPNGRLQSWSGSPERMYGQQYQGQYAVSRATSVTSMGSALPVSCAGPARRPAGRALPGEAQAMHSMVADRSAACTGDDAVASPAAPLGPACSRRVRQATRVACPPCPASRGAPSRDPWRRPREHMRRSCRRRARHAAHRARQPGSRPAAAPEPGRALRHWQQCFVCLIASAGWPGPPDWPRPRLTDSD